jgi:hypothetical protein
VFFHFSGKSFYRWQPSHNMQHGSWLQSAPWPSFWQL